MTRQKYAKEVIGELFRLMEEYGYSAAQGGKLFAQQLSDDVASFVTVRVVTGKLPASVIQLDLDAEIRSKVVADLGSKLVGRDASLPTLWGPLGRFLPRNDYVTSYRFDWNLQEDQQFARLFDDIRSFFGFVELVRSYRDLDLERLLKIPLLRKNFAEGLGENYRYTLPELAAILHKLNGREERAQLALSIAKEDQSGRLDAGHIRDLENFIKG